MHDQVVDYQRVSSFQRVVPWWRTIAFMTCFAVFAVGAINAWMVWTADKSWGALLWVFLIIPVGNILLFLICLGCRPVVRYFTGGSSTAFYAVVTMCSCIGAIFLDGAIIFAMVHGC